VVEWGQVEEPQVVEELVVEGMVENHRQPGQMELQILAVVVVVVVTTLLHQVQAALASSS